MFNNIKSKVRSLLAHLIYVSFKKYKHAIQLIKKGYLYVHLCLCTLIHKFFFLYTVKYISYNLGKLRFMQI